MPPRNHKDWLKKPNIEYVNSLIYSDYGLYEQEIEKIFSKVWIPVCHESELPEIGRFRTSQIAHKNVLIVNEKDGIQAYLYHTTGVVKVSGYVNQLDYQGWDKLHTEVAYGGMVWTTLNPNPNQSLKEWLDGAFDCMAGTVWACDRV